MKYKIAFVENTASDPDVPIEQPTWDELVEHEFDSDIEECESSVRYPTELFDDFTWDSSDEHASVVCEGYQQALYQLNITWPVPPTGTIVIATNNTCHAIPYTLPTMVAGASDQQAGHFAGLPASVGIDLGEHQDNTQKIKIMLFLAKVDRPENPYQQDTEVGGTTMAYYYLYVPCQILVAYDENA